MNEELLDTPAVKSQIERYLSEDYLLEHILEKLDFIHLIKISKEELKEFIKKNKLGEKSKHL